MIIRTENLQKRYGEIGALNGLSLAVPTGGIFAFLGPNGAGKTTTIRILCGLTRKTGGSAAIAGVDIDHDPLAAKRLCGLAAQTINLDGELTVAENLDFHGRLHNMPRPERRSRAALLLDYVDLQERAGHKARTLSGGMKRRAMLARALMHNPKLLFLDEPTAGLDPEIRRRIWSLVKKVSLDGVTVFLTTHYIEEAEFLADRVGFIDSGRLAAEGSPAALMARLGEWAVDRFGGDAAVTDYYPTRDAAEAHMAPGVHGLALRRVNLEDAFLALTGKSIP